MFKRFQNRREGGRILAEKLLAYKNRRDVMVLALPRGGVPVAYEVAKALNVPLELFLVRKLGVPFRNELAFGAIATGGVAIFNRSLMETFRIPDSMIRKVLKEEKAELERREKLYRPDGRPLEMNDKTVILVDDGLATGATMKAAVAAVRKSEPKQIVIAAPVASQNTCRQMTDEPKELCICAMTPDPFFGVGKWYRDFEQVSDREVCDLFADSRSTGARRMAGVK